MFRVDAGRDVERRYILGLALEFGGVLINSDRVLVDNAEDRLVVILHPCPGF